MGIRLEDNLLLCLSRANIDSERAEKIKGLLRNDINWQYLIQMALRHGLVALLYRNLKSTQSKAIPSEALDQLQKYFIMNAGRNIFLNEELVKLLNVFEVHGILAVPYKGPALAASIYGDIALRQFSDVDILIQKQDILKAKDLIVPLGYRPHFQLTSVNAKSYIKSQYGLSFTRHDGRVNLELQWEITPYYFNFSIPSLYLWESLERSSRRDSGFWKLSPEIELIIICVHGTKDRWTRLLWICDVAELVRINDKLDWDRVLRLSYTLSCLRMLFLGLYLAKDLLGASIPVEVMKKIESDLMVKRLAKQVRHQLFNGSNGSRSIFKSSLFHLKTREHLRDQIQYCLRFALMITPGDLTLFPLPKYLLPLYYIIRPMRLMVKYWIRPLERFLMVSKIFLKRIQSQVPNFWIIK